MTTSQPTLPGLGAGVLARRQLQFLLLLDCSGSMRGDRIASLNYAVRSALPELKSVAGENPEVELMVRVLRFDTVARWHIEDPTPVAEVEWEDVEAGGETALGAALDELTLALNADNLTGRQLPPVIVLVSDGYPTDDVDAAFDRFFAEEAVLAATRIAISIGSGTDIETLSQFMGNADSEMQPLQANNAPELVESIRWATTAPVKLTSAPTTAANSNAELAARAPDFPAPDSSVVW